MVSIEKAGIIVGFPLIFPRYLNLYLIELADGFGCAVSPDTFAKVLVFNCGLLSIIIVCLCVRVCCSCVVLNHFAFIYKLLIY